MKKTFLILLGLAIAVVAVLMFLKVEKQSFLARPVNLTMTTPANSPLIVKKTTVDKVREAVTELNGEEKRTQVYLIQRFLAEAKAHIKMSIDVDGDVYYVTNRVNDGDGALDWKVVLTHEKKVQALANFMERK